MKSRKLIAGLCCAVIGVFAGTSALAQSDAQFTKANQEYAAGHFKEAVDAYEALVRSREWSANLFYNLGNAYFRQNDFGHAILNYERALALDRHHPEAEANLRIVREETRALELPLGAAERLFAFAGANEYALATSTSFWVGALSIVALIFAPRRSRGAIGLSILSLSIFIAAVFAVYQIENGRRGKALAIVTSDGVEARLATADNANSVLALPSGSEIKIVSRRGDWIYASLPNDLRGWIPAKSAEPVRL